MKFSTIRFASIAVLSAVIALTGTAVQAGWGSLGGSYGGSWGGGSSGGSSGGYSVSYGSSGGWGSSGGVAPRFTPVRSLLRGIHNHIAAKFDRIHARRAAYASYGSSGGYYGSSGYSYGSSGYSVGYGSTGFGSTGGGVYYGGSSGSTYGGVSYGSTGSPVYTEGYGSTDGEIYYGVSNSPSTMPTDLISMASLTDGDAVYLTVNVPSSANIFVNGKPTTSVGSVRQFVSQGLVPGNSYKFDVRAELATADGKTVTEQKTVVMVAGSQQHLEFAFADTTAPVETSLTLNVPEGAKVMLAGNQTSASGAQRVFRSSHLKLGQAWDDYVVEVEVDGQVKRQAIRLIGGDNLELTFDFGGKNSVDHVAAK